MSQPICATWRIRDERKIPDFFIKQVRDEQWCVLEERGRGTWRVEEKGEWDKEDDEGSGVITKIFSARFKRKWWRADGKSTNIDVWEGASGASQDAPIFGLKSNLVSKARKKKLAKTWKKLKILPEFSFILPNHCHWSWFLKRKDTKTAMFNVRNSKKNHEKNLS